MKEPIRKITLKDGTVRYRLVVDVGRDENGRRQQITRTYDRRRDARDELSRIRHETSRGTYVKPSAETVNAYLDSYLTGATRDRRASTRENYRNAFRPVRERLGTRELQTITKRDIEELVDWMLTAGRRRGGTQGTGLGARSVRLTLGRLTAALEMAVREGKLVRNVAKLVELPRYEKPERATWSKAEVRIFLAATTNDRLHAAWRLSLYGLRRGEVVGLRWSDVDLKARTLKVAQARVIAEGEVLIEEPKSRNGKRTLPLDTALVDALKALKARQAAENLGAGPAYQASGYIVTDELGVPVHPDWYSDEFGRLIKRAGLPRITLHESRHTTLTLMEHAGVPVSIISKWAGHHDAAFTHRTYVHADNEDLKTGTKALARIYKIS